MSVCHAYLQELEPANMKFSETTATFHAISLNFACTKNDSVQEKSMLFECTLLIRSKQNILNEWVKNKRRHFGQLYCSASPF